MLGAGCAVVRNFNCYSLRTPASGTTMQRSGAAGGIFVSELTRVSTRHIRESLGSVDCPRRVGQLCFRIPSVQRSR
jgi:hypothetical protein